MKIVLITALLIILSECAFVTPREEVGAAIRINQIGHLTYAKKQSVVVSPSNDTFFLKNNDGKIVYTGHLLKTKHWNKSGENVAIADFSAFNKPGKYFLTNGEKSSELFEISDRPFIDLINKSTKYFYYHRASTSLPEKFAGQYSRPYAHPDTSVIVHLSGSSDLRAAGSTIKTPYGWYDAGDYNKYVVNSGISTYTLLLAYQHNRAIFDTLDLVIPESVNSNPDLMDEVEWNMKWMETMQDPDDGGVYHKTTTASFEGFITPDEANNQRFVVAKSTSAALNFAAVLSKYSNVIISSNPAYAKEMLDKAELAWEWAIQNPDISFENPRAVGYKSPAISTGEYGDRTFQDEFFWASVELYLATGKERYLKYIDFSSIENFRVPSWNAVETLGLISLSSSENKVPEMLKKKASDELMRLAEGLIGVWRQAPYRITLDDFTWGSNSTILNQGLVLINAYRNFGNTEYYEAALSALDYVLGRNAVGYCFVTGMGHLSPMNPHHRISASDTIKEPIPGMLVGGPNPQNVDQDCGSEKYEVLLPARCYIDDECSYSTNEVAINWNAPLVYLSASLQAIYLRDFSEKK